MASAAAQTLSAVPMSTRFTLRCAGTEGRWITPGVKTTGLTAATGPVAVGSFSFGFRTIGPAGSLVVTPSASVAR